MTIANPGEYHPNQVAALKRETRFAALQGKTEVIEQNHDVREKQNFGQKNACKLTLRCFEEKVALGNQNVEREKKQVGTPTDGHSDLLILVHRADDLMKNMQHEGIEVILVVMKFTNQLWAMKKLFHVNCSMFLGSSKKFTLSKADEQKKMSQITGTLIVECESTNNRKGSNIV